MFADIPDLLWWVLVIFVAGIIGQFGKSLTLKILDRFTGDKEAAAESEVEPANDTGERYDSVDAVAADTGLDVKEAKKRKKAELKRMKKEAKSEAKSGG